MMTRLLPRAEWPRLAGTELEHVWCHLDHDHTAIVVVETANGLIVACQAVTWYCHVEGLWIAPGLRHSREGARAGLLLWNTVRDVAQALGASAVITGALTDAVRDLITRANGVKLPGDAYVIPIGGSACRQLSPF